ncbi:hypothetical protein KCU91_g134, partial [Aureobasidium melanogenum]
LGWTYIDAAGRALFPPTGMRHNKVGWLELVCLFHDETENQTGTLEESGIIGGTGHVRDCASLDQQVESAYGRGERAKQIKDIDDSVSVLVRNGVALQQVSKNSKR